MVRHRRVVSYNLNSAGARQAFEQGLELAHDDDELEALGTSPQGSRRKQFSRPAPFALRTDAGSSPANDALPESLDERKLVDLISLIEIFPATTVDRQLVEDVYLESGYNFDVALERLMELTGSAEGSAHAGSSSHSAQVSHGGEEGAGAWQLLSEDLKQLILSMVPARDLARVAWTCWDFAGRVQTGRTNTRVLNIPAGLSLNGIVGMVAGHINARSVSLSKWAGKSLTNGDFAALLTAISQGSRSSRRSVPVEGLSFKGWRQLTDGNVMTICNTMQHLKELDLSDCGITDAALTALAKYQRLAPEPTSPAGTSTPHPPPSPPSPAAAAPSPAAADEQAEPPVPVIAGTAAPLLQNQQMQQAAAAAAAALSREEQAQQEEDALVEQAMLESIALLASSPTDSSGLTYDDSITRRLQNLQLSFSSNRAASAKYQEEFSLGIGDFDSGTSFKATATPAPGGGGGGSSSGQGSVAAVTCALGLQSIILAGCSKASSDGVRTLMAAPLLKGSLTSLDVSRCNRLTRSALTMPPYSALRVLKAAQCQNLGEVVIQLPPGPLRELHLNNCKQLTRVLVVAPGLQLLHVGGCKSLAELSLRTPRLTTLLANLCFRYLETSSLGIILAQAPLVKTLNVNGCNTLSSLAITGQHDLRSVDCSACKGLVTLHIASPGLHELRAKACPLLADVLLDSNEVQLLDVSHCTRLQRLQLPVLQLPLPPAVGASGIVGFGACARVGQAAAPVLPKLIVFGCEQLPREVVQHVMALQAVRAAVRRQEQQTRHQSLSL